MTGRLALGTTILVAGIAATPLFAQTLEQRTDERAGVSLPGRLDATGNLFVHVSTGDPLGTNPERAYQLYALDIANGTLEQWTDAAVGGAVFATVGDDGSRVAFSSRADLTGGNPDLSLELFVRSADGTDLRQLTSSKVGSVQAVAIAGDGGSIVFSGTIDPTGGNADLSQEIFRVLWDGTGMEQLTSSTGDSNAPAVSDDGARIVFASDEDLVGQNPLLFTQVFAIEPGATNLRQLTAAADGDCSFPTISGNGALVAAQCDADLVPPGNADLAGEVYLVDWTGGAPTQLTASTGLIGEPFAGAPALTDDAQTVFYHSNQNNFLQNIDGNIEVWRIGADGSNRTLLTSTIIDIGSLLPTTNGTGTRVGFVSLADVTGSNPDENLELFTMTGLGAGETQHTDTVWGWTTGSDIAVDDGLVVLTATSDLLGTNPERNGEIFLLDDAGLTQLTSTTGGASSSPSIAHDGSAIAVASTADLTGGNGDLGDEIFWLATDGSETRQLTNAGLLDTGSTGSPAISGDGAWIAFVSETDPLGTNVEGNAEIFVASSDGSILRQITTTATGSCGRPAIDGAATKVAFDCSGEPIAAGNPEANRELFVSGIDGTGLVQLTTTLAGSSAGASFRDDGSEIAFASSADLTGGNADENNEIHLIGSDGLNLRQLTDTIEGQNGSPAFTPDGTSVTFSSSTPRRGPNPDNVADLWRIDVDGTGLTPLTAAQSGVGALAAIGLGGGGAVSTTRDGARTVYTAAGDPVFENPDQTPELFEIDLGNPWRIRIDTADPTLVAWDPRAGTATYDLVRGDLASLSSDGSEVALGAVSCLEDDSPDFDNAGLEDAAVPAPGAAFFYVVRPDDRFTTPTYGTSTAGETRVASSGDCTP